MKSARLVCRSKSRGFSLVASIFVLVVLAALGAFMVTLSAVERWTTVGAAQGARAYQAAQAGLEWGIYKAVPPVGASSCVAAPAFVLNNFSVTVTCTPDPGNPYTEGANNNLNVYTISSTAVSVGTAVGSPDYFSRTLTVTVTNAP